MSSSATSRPFTRPTVSITSPTLLIRCGRCVFDIPSGDGTGFHGESQAGLGFEVFEEYDKDNILLRQSYDEVIDHQLEMVRFRRLLESLQEKEIVFKKPLVPTPFAFPIMADRMRQRLTTENVEERISRMSLHYSD